jgi:hypothetical protein
MPTVIESDRYPPPTRPIQPTKKYCSDPSLGLSAQTVRRDGTRTSRNGSRSLRLGIGPAVIVNDRWTKAVLWADFVVQSLLANGR